MDKDKNILLKITWKNTMISSELDGIIPGFVFYFSQLIKKEKSLKIFFESVAIVRSYNYDDSIMGIFHDLNATFDLDTTGEKLVFMMDGDAVLLVLMFDQLRKSNETFNSLMNDFFKYVEKDLKPADHFGIKKMLTECEALEL